LKIFQAPIDTESGFWDIVFCESQFLVSMRIRQMKWLKIQTVGEAQIESFTVLGASSARGDADKIGQFGSGAKHAILCALRAGLQIIICCGKVKVVPQTSPQTIHGVVQERVLFRIGNKTESSSMVLDFGALDWTSPVQMMLREFISNALDATGGQWGGITIEYCDDPRAKAGYTTIYLELTNEVREYVGKLNERFLHVSGKQNESVMRQERGTCRLFRKGVFVREISGANSMYSYNCGDELPIDESRNLDVDRVRRFATQLLCRDPSALQSVLRKIVETNEQFWERGHIYWQLDSDRVASETRALYGDDVCVTNNSYTLAKGQSKGINVKLISDAGGYYQAMTIGGVPDCVSRLCAADAKGLTVLAPSDELIQNVHSVWGEMSRLRLCGIVECPQVIEYEKTMTAGEMIRGFYDPKEHTIYVHRDSVKSMSVIIEELAHAVTGADDMTRDFQTYAFRLAGLLLAERIRVHDDALLDC